MERGGKQEHEAILTCGHYEGDAIAAIGSKMKNVGDKDGTGWCAR